MIALRSEARCYEPCQRLGCNYGTRKCGLSSILELVGPYLPLILRVAV